MNMSMQQINEQRLRKRICQFKHDREYRSLTEYLIGELASGHVPIQLQAKAYNELGLAHLQLDEPLEAEKSFLSAIERDPQALNPKFNLANLAMYAQRYEQAGELFHEILEMDPSHIGARFHAGLCLAMSDKPDQALPYFESSAKAAPQAMGPNFWAAETLVAQKRFKEALPYFCKAAEITPDHRESQRGIAICLLETGQNEECVEQCDTLILSGQGAEYLAWQIKGDALIEMGEIEAAALSHLELADMDFDARDFLIIRAKELLKEYPHYVSRYAAVISDVIPELEPAFNGICNDSMAEQ
ncbi:tetratricopeptide repeat protein [Maridesulfovibrio sp.]|uniref:tetratricopeptide repeat protein n=1 Tax=Maridesulfovibrio sp. TaxID=2795000 RepID=UPI003BA8ECD6